MKYVIDEDICKKENLPFKDIILLLYFLFNFNSNLDDSLRHLWEKGYLIKTTNGFIINTNCIDSIKDFYIHEASSTTNTTKLESLAESLRELFPKGMKTGSTSWRSNIREIVRKLIKFNKLYNPDNNYSDEDIIEATKRYIEHFNGDYTYMRILKYFILKNVTKVDEEGNGYVEEVSELATWLENDNVEDNNSNWTTNLV